MPRPTLPDCLRKLQTMTVLLTKTKEEDIKAHIQKVIVDWDAKYNVFRKLLNDVIWSYVNANPYDKYTVQDWRSCKPKLKYRYDKFAWMDEEQSDTFLQLGKIKSDLFRCVRAFPQWHDEFADTLYEMERAVLDTDELVFVEGNRYYTSKKKYEADDAEYIKERSARTDHDYCHVTKQKYLADDYTRKILCNGKEPAYWDTCTFCISHEQRIQDQKDYEAEQRQRTEEDERLYRETQKLTRQAELETRELKTCETCEYSTYGEDAFARHLDTKEHKIKQNHKDWKCELCAFQGRSSSEHEFHLQSTKHQKNAGLLEVVVTEYKCECCNYETKLKGNYERHLLSKGHAAKQ
jgi:hypothetical protein